ncbi:MAG: DUF3616 domain-containing protein [Paracoccaceae bacterium]
MTDAPIDTVTLVFRDQAAFEHVTDPIAEDLSALARVSDTLFLSCDETAGVDRLRPDAPGVWGSHEHVNLGAIFDLPDGPAGETDIEGLEADDGWLWVVGSHSLKRRKPKREENDAAEALRRMEKIKRDPNRHFLARLPLAPAADGGVMPVAEHEGRRAASVPLGPDTSALHDWLAGDPHLDPFLAIPSKENGLDVEGIAACGSRVWLGLRGPVLRGHAVILEFDVEVDDAGHLAPRPIGAGRAYRKHVLPSDGLGVRDLARDGDDLLVLTGPALGADGPSHVLRWRGALGAEEGVHAEESVAHLAELPYLGHYDHAEGLCRWPEAGEDAWLVVHDSPVPERLDAARLSVRADVLRLGR